MTHPDTTRPIYRVGPSGWSYPDWKGVVYPPGAASKFDTLAYIARFFDAVEVNASFYRPITHRMSSSWVKRTQGAPAFRFVFKLHQSFTHERADYSSSSVDTFLSGIAPVAEAARLGCILAQFPWSFRRTPRSVAWLRRLHDDFGVHALVAELRHDSWLVPETADELRAMNMGTCNIDQPQLRSCTPPTSLGISPVGYVRFHGRRADTWFAENVQPHDRYNYLYTSEELQEWLPRIRKVGSACPDVYVFCNNHFRGQGPANALQLRAMLEQDTIDVPAHMIERFPQLASIQRPNVGGFPSTLF